MKLLSDLRVMNVAINLPGPLAGARLAALGAEVWKVEPPTGDPLHHAFPEWYDHVHSHQRVLVLDLKRQQDLDRLLEMLERTDLLVTAVRPRSLTQYSLDWVHLHRRFPALCHVAITGYAPPDVDRPGHDLTYQAVVGLLDPPTMPRVLLADCAAAEAAVSQGLALLIAREKTGHGQFAYASAKGAVTRYADSLRYGATQVAGMLGGALAEYNLYQAKEGWVAVAALEPRFVESLQIQLGLGSLTVEGLAAVFARRTARAWEDWALQNDLPLVAVAKPTA